MSEEEGAKAAGGEGDAQKVTFVVHVPLVTPRTLPGLASVQNKGAIDWGGHGLLAYGSNYTVVVVDTVNVQVVQCLDKHKAMVKKVLWGEDYLRQDRTSQYPSLLYGSIDLVSSDATGHIIVWDVTAGQQLNVLTEGSKPVLDMNWVKDWYGHNHVLAALHPPNSLVLWDTRTGAKLWKKTYTESLLAFNFDPFNPTKMACENLLSKVGFIRPAATLFTTVHCTDCVLFVEDFSVSKVPSSNGRKFYVSSPKVSTSGSKGISGGNLSTNKGSVGNLNAAVQDEKAGARDKLRRLMKDLVIGENKPKADDGMTLNECLQVAYHRSIRHHIVLLYPREVLILDLHINQTVGIVPTGEKTSSPYLQVYSCKQRDVLYCLHESGSVSAKIKRKTGVPCSPIDTRAPSTSSLELNSESQLEVAYDHRCSSEPVRQTRGLQILGISVNPVCERRIALFLNSGKIIFLELLPTSSAEQPFHFGFNLNSSPSSVCLKRHTLNEILPPLMNDVFAQPPGLRLLVMGVLPSVAAPITALRMCPAITTRNWMQYSPLLAGGTTGGLIQLYNIASGCIEKELMVHSYTVRGIEWTGLKTFLSYAYPNTSSQSNLVRNELYLTDVLTGESIPLRTDKGEEPPIEILRVSPLKQYFIVVISGGPVELWDLKSRQLLRTMPKKFSVVSALEWSPTQSSRSIKRRQSSKDDSSLESSKTVLSPSSMMSPLTPQEGFKSILDKTDPVDKVIAKEYFVFTDTDNQLYSSTVDGSTLTLMKLLPSGTGAVTCIAFKADQIVQGDSDGLLSVWDLTSKQTRRHPTSRGYIRKMKFAPGKGNMKLLVLYTDGVDVIDLKGTNSSGATGGFGFERIGQLKCPRDMVKVLDVDWAACDKPVLATQDGCLRVMDMMLSGSSSAVMDYEFQDPIFCPALLPSEVAFKMRERLCWQPPDTPYTTQLTTEHGFTENQVALIEEQLSMVDEDRLACLRNPQFKTAERCLIVAQLFGDQTEIDLWTIALYYLKISRARSNSGDDISKPEKSLTSPVGIECKKCSFHSHFTPLDTCYDVLQDSHTYQRLQLERVSLHESRRMDYEHTKRVIQQQLLLGQSDRAVQLLLETDLNSPEYYTDAIKACLIATVQSTGAAQSTIKLVATNLIAHGTIWEGVQLLCLIGKGLYACRYLASYSRWGAAVWLARAVLPSEDASEVIKKWADHLYSQGHKEKAILVLISLEEWQAAHSLLSVVDPRRASLLAQSCQEFGINILS